MNADECLIDTGALNILYVEDDTAFAMAVAQRFLGGHEVAFASSICAARKLLDRPWDVILLDYDLPDGKGDTIIAEIRAAGDTTITIGVSARAEGNRNMLNAGANAVCPKSSIEYIGEDIEMITATQEVACG